jgi:hypothetical protein
MKVLGEGTSSFRIIASATLNQLLGCIIEIITSVSNPLGLVCAICGTPTTPVSPVTPVTPVILGNPQ